jgi:hypothetical protein
MRTFRILPTSIRHPWVQTGLCVGLVLATVGCQTVSETFKMKDGAGTSCEDPWTTQAGAEGRAGRSLEKEADPLNLRRFMMSEKAMEIERNCGYE